MRLSAINNKKIALGLFGISYQKNYKHWMGWETNIDWRKANVNTAFIPFIKKKNNLDVFISTYHSPLEKKLISDFKPKAISFKDFVCNKENEQWVKNRHLMFKQTLDLMEAFLSIEKYDYFIITRFDIRFNMDYIADGEIDKKSVNVTSKWCIGDDCGFVDDCFYMFNGKIFKTFKKLIFSLPDDKQDIAYYHKLHQYPLSPNFSFLIQNAYHSHTCPAYHIVR